MKSTSKKKEIPTNFPDIQTAEQLKIYLDDSTNRLKNSRFLYHYTTVEYSAVAEPPNLLE